MDSGERGMNPVAVTITNLRKEYWPSRRIKLATSCSQALYATDKFLDFTEFKTFGDYKFIIAKMIIYIFDMVGNIVEKGENAA